MSLWLIGWLLWLAWFVVEEGVAIATKTWRGTLSWQVWLWLSEGNEQDISWWVRVRRMMFLTLLAFMIAHFLFQYV